MNKFFAAFIALILFINIDAQEKKILTIEEAIRLGFQHNSNIKNSKFRMETSKSSLLSARSDLYPTITGNASWDWSRTDFKVGDNALSNESRSWGLGVSSRYNVFDGYSKYLNIGMKTRDIEAARLNLRRIHQEIVYRTITQYYRILNFTEILKVRKENLDWNIENQKIIQAKVDVGSGIMTDVRQQEVKVGQAELALVQAEQTLNDAKRELYYFLGLDVTDEYEFVDGVELLTKVKSDTVKGDGWYDLSIDDLISEAIKKRADYQKVSLELENAKSGVSMAESANMPTISNSLSYNVGGTTPWNILDSRTISFGFNLSIPIFSGYSITANEQIAQIQVKTKQLELSDLQKTIKRDLLQSYLEIKTAEKKIEVARKSIVSAEANRDLEEARYKVGAGTLINLQLANTDLVGVQVDYINSLFDLLLLEEQLKYDLGSINTENFE